MRECRAECPAPELAGHPLGQSSWWAHPDPGFLVPGHVVGFDRTGPGLIEELEEKGLGLCQLRALSL